MAQTNLPFKIGQTVEVRSFEDGYRGAWFRCKILNIYTEEGKLFYSLKYLDYSKKDIYHTQVYQRFQDEEKECLMVRPSYPPFYYERYVPKIEADRSPLVVVYGRRQVGDVVDWQCQGCFWCATVLELERKALQIELFPPPRGEGETYKAMRSDVRPTLDWSPEHGWTVPSMDGRKSQSVKLLKREKRVDHVSQDVCQTGKEQTEKAKRQKTERAKRKKIEGDTQQKTDGDTQQKTEVNIQQVKDSEDIQLNIDQSESVEAAVYDLEELIVRIEWIRKMLSPEAPDVGEGSTWKYQDYRTSSKGI
ncbi:Agenet-like domain-containing protein [Hirschfeldia incana]|nr:Agenet-like domain-containing protein [Hirschfeldia incana]